MTSPKLPFNHLSVQSVRNRLTVEALSIQELLQACLQRISCREAKVQAWTYLDIDRAKKRADEWDQALTQHRRQCLEAYPLLGIPIAVKDIFATLGLPTEWGMEIYHDRYFDYEAAVVSNLKAAGAIVLGKTVTTALATATAGPTTNPHNRAHTPGGSSSGSAAAVADGMVPLAIGSQTMGSVVRPAAYCGVFGFKPSFGLISRYGMMPVSQALDHVGLFARSLDDIQRLFSVLAKSDLRDPDCQFTQRTVLAGNSIGHGNRPIRLGLVKTPYWEQAEDIVQTRVVQAAEVLGQADIIVDLVTLPAEFDRAWYIVQTLCAYGLYQDHGALLTASSIPCPPLLERWLKRGRSISNSAYQEACQWRARYRQLLTSIFTQYDAVLTPSTTGPAPLGLDNTGSPIFCGLWTLCGVPALNLPIGYTADGLPLGCQLVGARYCDRHLLNIAEQCWQILKKVFGDIQIPVGPE
ncbi:MAG: amidase [Cyanobacteria bacterium J06632_22]